MGASSDSVSTGGTMMWCRAAFHMGSLATCFVRHRLAVPDGVVRHGAVAGAVDGSLVALAALWDAPAYEVLAKVQRALVLELQHAGALNPIAFRCVGRIPSVQEQVVGQHPDLRIVCGMQQPQKNLWLAPSRGSLRVLLL